eukprot:3613127-Amphidinium_carterae.1
MITQWSGKKKCSTSKYLTCSTNFCTSIPGMTLPIHASEALHGSVWWFRSLTPQLPEQKHAIDLWSLTIQNAFYAPYGAIFVTAGGIKCLRNEQKKQRPNERGYDGSLHKPPTPKVPTAM